jgi:carboxymethylenebutenolidase
MTTISIDTSDGGKFNAYCATPSSGSGPGLMVIQEIFGVNKVMRDLCDGFAEAGYIAVSPDLFWRQEPGVELTDKSKEEWDKAFGYLQGFDYDKGMADIAATIGHVRGMDGCSGKVGTVGYCLGGSLAFMSSCFTDTDASVGYYAVQIEGHLEKGENISTPLMLHIAEKDGFCPPEAQEQIKAGLGPNQHVTIHSYAGVDHAFARVGGEHFDQAAAEMANGRTADYFKTHLG